ncbi:MAG: hypothetical protein M3N13_07155 [Candidatus Eremiobacteraeota bacterium]|nr:hypothetical protein [Candidatus Eremiobacteraeota bacterium]
MTIRSIFACFAFGSVAILPALAAGQPIAAQTAPSAEVFYRRALEQTRRHAMPAFATYAAMIDGLDCSVEDAGKGVRCGLKLSGHSVTKEPLQVAYRAIDDRLAFEQRGRSFVSGDGPFLNATWRGVDDLIRWGFLGKPAAKPQSAATIDPQSRLPVIAVVSSLSPDAYRVDDAGASVCSNRDLGHMVRLTALRDPLRYPLSAAVVNMRTGALCMLRFGARVNAAAGLVGANGVAELDLANESGYELVQHERLALNLRTVGIAVKHFDVGIAFSNYAFPQSLPPIVFATPEPSPQPAAHAIISPRERRGMLRWN